MKTSLTFVAYDQKQKWFTETEGWGIIFYRSMENGRKVPSIFHCRQSALPGGRIKTRELQNAADKMLAMKFYGGTSEVLTILANCVRQLSFQVTDISINRKSTSL